MISINSLINNARLEQNIGLGPHVFGASTRPNHFSSIIPSGISKEMKDVCQTCRQKLGLSADILEKKGEETFRLVEETIPGTSEKVFVIR